ncbi:MAG TPA: hypothetical protein VFQ80_13055, partial [Thermomicrobiales bacterium]|nr:hypothetical protein [Thermomicrobiales bacterium]
RAPASGAGICGRPDPAARLTSAGNQPMETPTTPIAARMARTTLAVTVALGSPNHAGESAPLTPDYAAGALPKRPC